MRRAKWYGGIIRISPFYKMPSICAPCPKGRMEDLLLFVVPKAHQTAALNEMQDIKAMTILYSYYKKHFWWPRMAKQMRQTIRACTCCLQYEGGFPKAPSCPIVATAPLDLLHVNFTSIETM